MTGDRTCDAPTVLVVDDDPQMVECIETYVEQGVDGATVLTAERAMQALTAVETTAVDCVVSDYEMPGMNGVELCLAVRKRDPALPVIIFSASQRDYLDEVASIAGVTEVVRKDGSGQFEVLVEQVEKHIGEGSEKGASEAENVHDESLGVAANGTPSDENDRRRNAGNGEDDGTGHPAGDGDDGAKDVTGGDVAFSECTDRERFDVATTLRTVADALESGRGLTLQAYDRAVTVGPQPEPTVSVTVTQMEDPAAASRVEFTLALHRRGDGFGWK